MAKYSLYEINYVYINFSYHELDGINLHKIISDVFLDLPPQCDTKYNFLKHPPKITGQIGVPLIIDGLLGNKHFGCSICTNGV